MRLLALDDTVGYGSKRTGLSLAVEDRLALARELDRLGISYIDGGCPAVDPKSREFFARLRTDGGLMHAYVVAGIHLNSVHAPVERDAGLAALLDAGSPAVALSCRCFRADEPLVREAVRHARARAREVIFRAEDFFDAFCADRRSAMRILEAARIAGADVLCLCDSAGNTLPHTLREICAEVRKRFDGIIGISARDDCGLAVANTLEAVEQGLTYIEGSILGHLETAIRDLECKLGHTVIGPDQVSRMPEVVRFAAEAATVTEAAGDVPVPTFQAERYELRPIPARAARR